MIRAATTAEADAVAALAADTFPMACPPDDPPEDVAAFIAAELTTGRFATRLADPGQSVLVAAEGACLVGYALVVHAPPTDPEVTTALRLAPTAELSKCYVRADHHGTGTAAALVDAGARVAVERGAAGLWLGVSSVNVRAQRFYAKQGFTAVGHKNFRVGSQIYRDLVLERVLTER